MNKETKCTCERPDDNTCNYCEQESSIQILKEAAENIYSNRILKASLSYMELAETGISTAMLNSAIVFEKINIFDSNSTFLSRNVENLQNKSEINMFNINNYIAFNYLKMAINH